MVDGQVGILNVGAGDVKLSFDPKDPAERIRAARIVKDMIRRGYAILVATGKGKNFKYVRAHDFDEKTCEYIIADFDPLVAAESDRKEVEDGQSIPAGEGAPATARRGRGRPRRVDAGSVPAVSVARTAGG